MPSSSSPQEGCTRAGRAVGADEHLPTHPRRIISIEILNPLELAGAKGRLAAVAGSLAPGLTRRIVYDQVVKALRKQLSDQHVVADVQVHNLHPLSPEPDASTDDVQTPVVVLDPGRANNY